jgi:hypothetical protein
VYRIGCVAMVEKVSNTSPLLRPFIYSTIYRY